MNSDLQSLCLICNIGTFTLQIGKNKQYYRECSSCGTTQVENALTETPASIDDQDIVYRLRKRAEIQRQIYTPSSAQDSETDRIADLLEDAANEIERLRTAK